MDVASELQSTGRRFNDLSNAEVTSYPILKEVETRDGYRSDISDEPEVASEIRNSPVASSKLRNEQVMSRVYGNKDREDFFNEVLVVDADDDEVYQKRSHRRHVQ
jgi:hypothetical protein